MVSRRSFVGMAAGAVAAVSGTGCSSLCCFEEQKPKFLFGACRPVSDSQALKELGYDFVEQNVASLLKPDMPDAEYEAKVLPESKQCALPIRSCNGFLPGSMRLTGPEDALQWDAALKFADVAFRRADELGIKYIVLGSSKARKAPDGFSKDKTREQFVEFCKRLADRMEKGRFRVTVLLEPLRAAECNMFNYVSQGIDFVDRIGSPHVRLLADIYHMCSGNEQPEVFAKAGNRILHCHIATRAHRMAPGLEEDNLSSYLKALADTGYCGGVSIEGGWKGKDFREAAASAIELMREWSV